MCSSPPPGQCVCVCVWGGGTVASSPRLSPSSLYIAICSCKKSHNAYKTEEGESLGTQLQGQGHCSVASLRLSYEHVMKFTIKFHHQLQLKNSQLAHELPKVGVVLRKVGMVYKFYIQLHARKNKRVTSGMSRCGFTKSGHGLQILQLHACENKRITSGMSRIDTGGSHRRQPQC